MKTLIIAVSLFFGVTSQLEAHATKLAPRVNISAKGNILRGNSHSFTAIGSVDRKTVFQSIPAYQQIQRERLNRTDPQYHFLLAKANRDFNQTLDRICKLYKLDLIVEKGSIRAVGIKVYDVTGVMSRLLL